MRKNIRKESRRESLSEFQTRLKKENFRRAASDDLMQAILEDERVLEDELIARDLGVDDESYIGTH